MRRSFTSPPAAPRTGLPMQIRRLIPAATLAAFVLVPGAARAQDAVEVRPGSTILDPSRIAPRTDTFTVELEGVDEIQLVIRTATLGDTALLRVERLSFETRELDTDSFAVRRPTLAPLFIQSRGVSSSSRVVFPPGRAEGTFAPSDGAGQTISETLDAPLFYSNSIDLVLASLPLEAGRSFTLHMWSPRDLNDDVQARVVSRETVTMADGGRCGAWRVETTDGSGGASVYWFEERTHALLRYSTGGMQIRIVHHAACPRDDASRRATR